MSKKISEVLLSIQEILTEHENIKTFCNTNFQELQKVYLGYDHKYTNNDKVAIFVTAHAQQVTDFVEDIYKISIRIKNETILKNGNKSTTEGFLQLVDFWQVCREVLETSHYGVILFQAASIYDIKMPNFGMSINFTIRNLKNYRR